MVFSFFFFFKMFFFFIFFIFSFSGQCTLFSRNGTGLSAKREEPNFNVTILFGTIRSKIKKKIEV